MMPNIDDQVNYVVTEHITYHNNTDDEHDQVCDIHDSAVIILRDSEAYYNILRSAEGGEYRNVRERSRQR
jgi:hypothetical protein